MISSAGEESVKQWLSSFCCPINKEIENFIRSSSIEFAKKGLSITYIVVNAISLDILGYFALTHRPVQISDKALSNNSRKKLLRDAKLDSLNQMYNISSYLIAQFGKNYNVKEKISGVLLMQYAENTLLNIKKQIGGNTVYLDCEDKPELRSFYEKKVNFRYFGTRISESDNRAYLQYIKFL